MLITMDLLLTRSTVQNPEIAVIRRAKRNAVEDVKLLPGSAGFASLSPEHLYMTDRTDPAFLSSLPKSANVLCAAQSTAAQVAWPDVTVLQTEMDFADLYNALHQCYHDFMEWERRIDYAIYQENDFQDLIDASEELLDLPMLVYDPSLKLLAFSKRHQNLDDKIFQDAVRTGYLNPDAVSYFRQTHFFDEMKDVEFAFGMPDDFRQNEERGRVDTHDF